MALRKRIAVSLPPSQSLEDTIAVVRYAEANGFDDGWFSDPGAPDGLTMAAAISPYVRSLRIGMAIVPVYTRSPTVLAASADVIGQALPDRFVLGLGSSSQTIMEAFNGITLEKPLTRVKETAIMVRSMLRGEKTNFTEMQTLYSRGYLQCPAHRPIPVYLAALRPKMIEMAAEIGDGVIFNLWPRSALPRMLEHVRIGGARAGRNREDIEIVNRYSVIVTDDKAGARERFRRVYIPYFVNPVYNRFLSWAGFSDEARELMDGWANRDRAKTAAAFHDELVDEIGVIGTADEVRDRIREHAEQGICTSIIAPLNGREVGQACKTFDVFSAANFQF